MASNTVRNHLTNTNIRLDNANIRLDNVDVRLDNVDVQLDRSYEFVRDMSRLLNLIITDPDLNKKLKEDV